MKLVQEFLEGSYEDLEHLTRPFITKYRCTQYQNPTKRTETQKLLQAIIVIVHIIESNRFLLEPVDFITQVWGPLLKSIVDIVVILRMNIGESSPVHGAIARKRIYSETCVGFKVDLRLGVPLYPPHGTWSGGTLCQSYHN
ncbi:hypothetical protein K492DRAFT_124277 [Lichtheimia hyalospora FSU 10163]|nr:hypothetical protein K492DRAFT_124277 [Lichtheimia hyalospora FSU 10163]